MSGKREVFHVQAGARGGWDVNKEGNKGASAHAQTKEKAIAIGKGLAKRPKLGRLVIHRQDGLVQTQYAYSRKPAAGEG